MSFITQPFPCSHSLCWICPPSAPVWMVGLWQSPCCDALNCYSSPFLLSLSHSFFYFPSHFFSLPLFICPSLSPALLICHTLSLFSFLFSRGGSRKLWRVQSSGRGSEEHWSWQLLVHEQTAGWHPGKHVCVRGCSLSQNKLIKIPTYFHTDTLCMLSLPL